MKLWQICLSLIGGILSFVLIMNSIANGFQYNASIEVVTPSMFYTGVLVIVLSIAILYVVIISCTSRIIKKMNDREK